MILPLCDTMIDATGKVVDITKEDRDQLQKLIEDWSGEGLRTLCLAFRDMDREHDILDATEDTGKCYLHYIIGS